MENLKNLLNSNISILPSYKDSQRKFYAKLNIRTLKDLLIYHPPLQYIYTSFISAPSRDYLDKSIVIFVQPIDILTNPKISNIITQTAEGHKIYIKYFTKIPIYIKKLLTKAIQEETFLYITGELKLSSQGEWHITHPRNYAYKHNREALIEPVYGLTAGLSNYTISKLVTEAITYVKLKYNAPAQNDNLEYLTPLFLKENDWISILDSIYAIHQPSQMNDIHIARQRLAFDEILHRMLSLKKIRLELGQCKKNVNSHLEDYGKYRNYAQSQLPFELTDEQNKVLQEIYQNQLGDIPMSRLLQGDVGSGKTIVAILAILHQIELGGQVAFMVPTEVLAEQHYNNVKKLLEDDSIACLIVGSSKKKYRRICQESILENKIRIVIGTHTLFQDSLQFPNLKLVIIDEQHKFGVEQRMRLLFKGQNSETDAHCDNNDHNNGCDLLMMTATPIPRSMELLNYGDMDISTILSKPKNRQEIVTKIMSARKMEELYSSILRIARDGQQIYWICNRVSKDEDDDNNAEYPQEEIITVYDRAEKIKEALPELSYGILHGKMKDTEKNEIMREFIDKKFSLLISTTVVEVGIDNPNATVIIIENAENFGLAQLHQLRGRVGRGHLASYCILLYGNRCGKISMARLNVLKNNSNGFEISQQDLQLRGGGNILGKEQSGQTRYAFFSEEIHVDILHMANQYVASQLSQTGSNTPESLNILSSIFNSYDPSGGGFQ